MANRQGSPRLENGWTQIANEILEELGRINLYPYEARVLFIIIRKTYGWHKKMDFIRNSDLVKDTGITKTNVSRALRSLVQKNIIICEGNTKVKKYGLQKDYTRWGREKQTPNQLSVPITNELSKEITKLPEEPDELLSAPITELSKEITTVINSDNNTISISDMPKEKKETIQKKGPYGRKQVALDKDPRVKEILNAVSEKVGYQIPHYAKEGTAVKRALKMGFSPGEFIACWEMMKTFAFWKGKWLPLAKVTENLGEFVKGRLSDGPARKDQRAPPSRRAPASAEDLAKGW